MGNHGNFKNSIRKIGQRKWDNTWELWEQNKWTFGKAYGKNVHQEQIGNTLWTALWTLLRRYEAIRPPKIFKSWPSPHPPHQLTKDQMSFMKFLGQWMYLQSLVPSLVPKSNKRKIMITPPSNLSNWCTSKIHQFIEYFLHGSMPLMLWNGAINEGITFMPINNKHKWLLHNREVGSLLSLTSRDFVLWFGHLVLNLSLQWILGQGDDAKHCEWDMFGTFLGLSFCSLLVPCVWLCGKLCIAVLHILQNVVLFLGECFVISC